MAVIMLTEVMIQLYDRTKHVENKFLKCLNKYLDECSTNQRTISCVSCDFKVFCHLRTYS